MDGGREQIQRPRVRHETDGEVRLATYKAASSSRNLFYQIVASVAEGLPVRGVERVTGKAVSRSAASSMWAEKSREQLAMLWSRPLSQADWLGVLVDGVWLTREICVIIGVGIDATGRKPVLNFELGPSACVTAMTALIKCLAARVGGRGQESGDCWWAGMLARQLKLRCGACGRKHLRSHARSRHHAIPFPPPRVSNDNPHAKSLFRTIRYHSSLPSAGFASLEEARAWTHRFVQWYNHEHLQRSLRFVTPAQKHDGEDTAIPAWRTEVPRAAKERHPERWNGRRTRNLSPFHPIAQRIA